MNDTEDPRLARARAAFEAVHATDPKGEAAAYHAALAQWVQRLHPGPEVPVPLRLAAWCQHLRRWALPREDFAPGRGGYKKWRATLARQHAAEAGEILREVGFDDATIERVGALLVKKGLGRDADTGVLEDAACLVFLQLQLSDFVDKHPADKVVAILQKTWAKMTPAGHAAAQEVVGRLPASTQRLVARALA